MLWLREALQESRIGSTQLLYGLEKFAKSPKGLLQIPVLKYTMEDAILSSQIEPEMEKAEIFRTIYSVGEGQM